MKWEVKHFPNWVVSWTSCFFRGLLASPGRTGRQTSYSDLGIWQTFSRKWNKANLPYQGKQLVVFVANDTVWGFKWMLIFWETYVCHCELDSDSLLKIFLVRSMVILMSVTCRYWMTKYVSIGKICITQQTYIFRLASACYKIIVG